MGRSLTIMFDLMLVLLVSFILLSNEPESGTTQSQYHTISFLNIGNCLLERPQIMLSNNQVIIADSRISSGTTIIHDKDSYILSIPNWEHIVYLQVFLPGAPVPPCHQEEIRVVFTSPEKFVSYQLNAANAFWIEIEL